MTDTITIRGDAALLAALDALPNKIFRRVVVPANGKAMKRVIASARRMAPRDQGLLKKSLGAKTKVYGRDGNVYTAVGPRKGFGQQVTRGGRTMWSDPLKYAHLVEEGHRIAVGGVLQREGESSLRFMVRRHRKGNASGSNAGFVPGTHFMRRAYTENRAGVLQVHEQILRQNIEKEAKRAAKGAK